MTRTYTVAYRMGVPARCEWRRTVAFATLEEAQTCAAAVERAGRKALIFDTARLDAIGMPEGWEAGAFSPFRLVGRATRFVEQGRYLAAGFIPTVVGHTADGRWKTTARVVDVLALPIE